MKLNDDMSKRVVLLSTVLPWQSSPAAGVQRRLLARDGDEDAKATSIVRYEPGAMFAPHAHPLGEEIVVLDGEFADEHGTYPAGTYIKIPTAQRMRREAQPDAHFSSSSVSWAIRTLKR